MSWNIGECNAEEFDIIEDDHNCTERAIASIRCMKNYYRLCQKHYKELRENDYIMGGHYTVKKREWTTRYVEKHIGTGEQKECGSCEETIPEHIKRFNVFEAPEFDQIENPLCLDCMYRHSESMEFSKDAIPEQDMRKMRDKKVVKSL